MNRFTILKWGCLTDGPMHCWYDKQLWSLNQKSSNLKGFGRIALVTFVSRKSRWWSEEVWQADGWFWWWGKRFPLGMGQNLKPLFRRSRLFAFPPLLFDHVWGEPWNFFYFLSKKVAVDEVDVMVVDCGSCRPTIPFVQTYFIEVSNAHTRANVRVQNSR